MVEVSLSSESPRILRDTVPPRVGPVVRARRRQMGLTLKALCHEAGLSVGYLSQIERDQATPSLATLAAIAHGLGVGIDYFIAAPRAQEALSRQEGRTRFSIHGSSVAYERLSSEFAGSEMSSFLMHVPSGYRSETVSHDGEELVVVLEGEITQWLDGQAMVLHTGDALHFRGNRRHAFANLAPFPARMLWTGTLTLFRPRPSSVPAPSPFPTQEIAE